MAAERFLNKRPRCSNTKAMSQVEAIKLESAPTTQVRNSYPRNPRTYQPLLFAPTELLACGLCDAHHHPLVGERTADGVRSWHTSPEKAWEHTLVELARTANSYCSVVFDCDSRESIELSCAVQAGYGDLPLPNYASLRPASGHLQIGWNLRTPVHRGATARPRPLAILGRITEFYADALRSDRNYVGVLAYNPIHSDYRTIYPRSYPYDLAELAEPIPARWRRPARAVDLATEPGRNCHLFAALCKLALRCSDDGLLTWARRLNSEFAVPLPDSEVLRSVWPSVCRYRARWRVRGHKQAWLWKQAAVGKRGGKASGVVRTARLAVRDRQWAVLHHNGSSYRDIARVEGVDPMTVYRAVARSLYR